MCLPDQYEFKVPIRILQAIPYIRPSIACPNRQCKSHQPTICWGAAVENTLPFASPTNTSLEACSSGPPTERCCPLVGTGKSSLLNHLGGHHLSEVFRPGSNVGSTLECTASVRYDGQSWLLRSVPSSSGRHLVKGTRSNIGSDIATWSDKACSKAATLAESVPPGSRIRSGLYTLSAKTFSEMSAAGIKYAEVDKLSSKA
jgi:hypothetical protein